MTEPLRCLIDPSTPMLEICAEWIASEVETQLKTRIYETYVRAHFVPYFGTIGRFTDATCGSYGPHRLNAVLAATARKELSALRWLAEFCERRGYLSRAPLVPKLRRRAMGTSAAPKSPPTELTRAETMALIAALPDWSRSRRTAPFPVRARFLVAYETGLRPSTLDQLEASDLDRAQRVLRIRNPADKNAYGRSLPLTDAAYEALVSVCPTQGLIFGEHDYRSVLEETAEEVLPPEKAKTIEPYGLRHRRLTEFAATGNLPAAGYLAEHRQITTIDNYARPTREDAALVLAVAEEQRAARLATGGSAVRAPVVPATAAAVVNDDPDDEPPPTRPSASPSPSPAPVAVRTRPTPRRGVAGHSGSSAAGLGGAAAAPRTQRTPLAGAPASGIRSRTGGPGRRQPAAGRLDGPPQGGNQGG